MKTNVLYLTHSAKKGGAEQSLIHLINNVDTKHYNIFLVTPRNTEYLEEITVPYKRLTATLDSIRKKLGLSYINDVLTLIRYVIKYDINIVHANGWRAPWFAAPLFFFTRVKLIWHHRDIKNSFMYNVLLPKIMDKVICISDAVKNTLDKKYINKYHVIYNGVRVDDNFKRHIRKINNNFSIATIGRIVGWKRFDLVIKALYIFNQKNEQLQWKLFIVGDTSVDGSESYLNYLKQLVEQYNLTEKVIFYGYTKDPMQIMAECDLTINFSDKEPFGRVIIESLLAGTPVIVSESGGAPEIVKETQGGLIVKDGDVDALAEAIDQIYKMSEDEYFKVQERGYYNVIERFNIKNIVKEIEKLYEL